MPSIEDTVLRLAEEAENDPAKWHDLDVALDADGWNINILDHMGNRLTALDQVTVDRAFRLGILVAEAVAHAEARIIAEKFAEGAVEVVQREAPVRRRPRPRRRG
jgi:hypothetical protein